MWTRIFKQLTISCLLIVTPISFAATLTSVSISSATENNNKTQIKLAINGSAAYKVSALTQPDRLVIDLDDTKLSKKLNLAKLNTQDPIQQIRSGNFDKDTLRLVLDLSKPLHLDSVALRPTKHGEELILAMKQKNLVSTADNTATTDDNSDQSADTTSTTTSATNNSSLTKAQAWVTSDLNTDDSSAVTTPSQQPTTKTANATNANEDAANQLTLNTANPTTNTAVTTPQNTAAKTATAPTPKLVANNSAVTLTEPAAASVNNDTDNTPVVVNTHRPVVVVIDAGHGGKDPGTIGVHATQEKDVVLAIAKTLQDTINQQPGFRATLTRSRDYFIPLRQRLQIARQDKADMFVAIHADAYQDSVAAGASIFALSPHGASSEAARWLAEKENYSELGNVTLSDKSDVLRSVLIDLSQTATISSSVQMGNSILQQIGKVGPLHHGYVEQAPFMVLKNPDIPSLLVETGFLSNPQEEARLRDADYQQKLATAICTGIKNYFASNPPPGTLLAALKSKSMTDV